MSRLVALRNDALGERLILLDFILLLFLKQRGEKGRDVEERERKQEALHP